MVGDPDRSFDRDLEHVIRGRMAGGSLDVVMPILAELEARVDRRVMTLLRQEKGLTEEQALQAWYEKAAIVQLRERLEKLQTMGQSAGYRIARPMNGELNAAS